MFAEVVMYRTRFCPYCTRAAALLHRKGAEVREIDVSNDPPASYEDENWPAQAASGLPAPGAMMPPHALSRFGSALRTPVGPIHFAGSESATDWCGYMSGAIQAGFRAATEVLTALSGA